MQRSRIAAHIYFGDRPLPQGDLELLERIEFSRAAVEHNAWWDAMALRRRLMRHELP